MLSGSKLPTRDMSNITHVKSDASGTRYELGGPSFRSLWKRNQQAMGGAAAVNRTSFTTARKMLRALKAGFHGTNDVLVSRNVEVNDLESRKTEKSGGTNSTTERTRVPDADPHRSSGSSFRDGGSLTIILACVVGVIACALTVVGTYTVLRSPPRRALDELSDDEDLPLIVTAAELGSDVESEDVQAQAREEKADKRVTDSVVEGLVRDVLDEITPEEAV